MFVVIINKIIFLIKKKLVLRCILFLVFNLKWMVKISSWSFEDCMDIPSHHNSSMIFESLGHI